MTSGEGTSLYTDELLIEEVRERPILYDQRLKTYRDKQLQNDAWLEVAAALKQIVAEVQHRWNYLRQKFLRLRKVYAKSGSGAADVEKSWVLMPHLMFLKDAIQRRSLHPNFDGVALFASHLHQMLSWSYTRKDTTWKDYSTGHTSDRSAQTSPAATPTISPATVAPGP
ncbi:hypothetical protein HPB50_018974 [Hyalomma asiaticum]|uniref:Uncharacterized protein n=1 Tax=Hyalomma asiaticum TaxID=266040 RepID=A0ACB7TKE8_HYAAI|nr:hypothetical protein HPB50_018974 [Hyalomma asiaticum]